MSLPLREDVADSLPICPVDATTNIVICQDKNSLYCLDAEDGHLLWQRKYYDSEQLFCAPASIKGHRLILFLSHSSGLVIQCISLSSGEKIWRRTIRLGKQPLPNFPVLYQPHTQDGLCLAISNGLYRFDMESGRVVWAVRELWKGSNNEFELPPMFLQYDKLLFVAYKSRCFAANLVDGTVTLAHHLPAMVSEITAVPTSVDVQLSGDFLLCSSLEDTEFNTLVRCWLYRFFPSKPDNSRLSGDR
jgi:hypothetical protein